MREHSLADTPSAREALTLVQQYHSTVSGVVIHPDGRWMFFSPQNETHFDFTYFKDLSVLENLMDDLQPGVYFDHAAYA